MNIQFIKIDLTVKDRDSKWALACPTCQYEREVSYCQIWNIKKGKSTGDCRKCAESKCERDMSGLNLGRKYNGKSNRSYEKNKNQMEIVATFGNGLTEETREKMSAAKKGKYGELASRWEGGKTKERILLTSRIEYKQFRTEVFVRDSYKCVLCGNGGKLEMDHIKEWCNYPELRFESSNCRTLCLSCHRNTDNFGTKAIRKR